MSYRIKTIEQMTGLSRNTITAWERRYDLLEPRKDASGYRAYADSDVELLLRVRTLLDQGFQIGEVVAKIRAERTAGTPVREPADSIPDLRESLLGYMLDLDRVGAEEVVTRMLELSFRRRLDDVYIPLLHEIGDGWAAGRYSVAQEHFSSAFIREQMVTMLKSLEVGPRDGALTVCAGFPGEQHELGLLAVAIHLALRGHRIVYLGANLPMEDLTGVLLRRPANLACVSAMAFADTEAIYAAATKLRADVPEHTFIAFGGPAVGKLEARSQPGLLFCTQFHALVEHLDERRAVGRP